MVVKAAKPPKVRWTRFHDPVYSVNYTVCVGGTPAGAFRQHCRVWKLGTPDEAQLDRMSAQPQARGAFTPVKGDKSASLWFPDVPRVPDSFMAAIVAHEASHAALFCFAKSGVAPPSHPDHTEAFCYYVDFLVGEIWKALWPGGKT